MSSQREAERERRIVEETWGVIREAVEKGYIKEANRRIQKLAGISESEANEIIEDIKKNSSMTPNKSCVPSNRIIKSKAVKCLKCGKLYYEDMEKCPQCGTMNSPTSIDEHLDKSKTRCTACSEPISTKAESCPHCGQPTGIHVCPKCQSINTKVISGANKAASIFLWGPFAANKVVSKFQCKDCGHKW